MVDLPVVNRAVRNYTPSGYTPPRARIWLSPGGPSSSQVSDRRRAGKRQPRNRDPGGPKPMLSPASKLLALIVFLASTLAAGAQAEAPPTLAQLAASKLGLSCSKVTTSDNVSYMRCSGEIPSFDGLGLDTDLSIPLGVTQTRPTLVMLHGWSQDKTFWEAGTAAGDGAGSWHWNNVWFASKGWGVINYTPRGFQQARGMTHQDPNCTPTRETHLPARRLETLDAQV